MELVQVSQVICIRGHLASIGQLVAEEAQRPAVASVGTCSLLAGLINDPKNLSISLHVQLTITECS